MHCAGIKLQTAGPIYWFSANNTDSIPLEEELPVLLISNGENMDDTSTIIFTLKAHTSTAAPSVTNANAVNSTLLTLVGLTNSSTVDEVYQHAARQLNHAQTEMTLKKM